MEAVFKKVFSKDRGQYGKAWSVVLSVAGVDKFFSIGWSNKLAQGLNPGDNVEFVSETNEKGFEKIKAISKSGSVVSTPTVSGVTTTVSASNSGSSGSGGFNEAMSRGNALKVAAELVKARVLNPNGKKVFSLDQVLKETVVLSDHFFVYLKTGVLDVVAKEETDKIEEVVGE